MNHYNTKSGLSNMSYIYKYLMFIYKYYWKYILKFVFNFLQQLG